MPAVRTVRCVVAGRAVHPVGMNGRGGGIAVRCRWPQGRRIDMEPQVTSNRTKHEPSHRPAAVAGPSGTAGRCEIFADGFAGGSKSPGDAQHRPAGVAIAPDGSLYVSDDIKGRIYKISYTGAK